MIISRIHLNNFRCFKKQVIDFSAPITLIQGSNGSGKTSLLEALYYACYLRSFRAFNARDLIAMGAQQFHIKVDLYDTENMGPTHELSVGYDGTQKLVKFDQRTIASYKELMDYYRVVALFEDDLALIKEGPERRRMFVDHALLLLDPTLLAKFHEFKTILDNRNALLKKHQGGQLSDYGLYTTWTEQLFHISMELAHMRIALLKRFEQQVNILISQYFGETITITIEYIFKKSIQKADFKNFNTTFSSLLTQELRFGRSLFGAHLDDFSINYKQKQSRFYASRGQQKLTVLLLKIALLTELTLHRGKTLFLLDDFMTDFDEEKIKILVNLLSGLNTQLIFTSPAKHSAMDTLLNSMGAEQVYLSE